MERCFYYCHCGIGGGTTPTFWVDARNASRPCGVNCSRPHSFRSACHAHQPLPLHRPRPVRIDSFTCAPVFAHQHHRWRDAEIPARPATGGAESTQTMGKVAAEMCTATGTSTPAELLRPATVIHHFATQAARTPYVRSVSGSKTLSNAATSG